MRSPFKILPGVWVEFVCHYPHHPFGGSLAAWGVAPQEPWSSEAARSARRRRRQGHRELRPIPERAVCVPPAQAESSLAKLGATRQQRPQRSEASTPDGKHEERSTRAKGKPEGRSPRTKSKPAERSQRACTAQAPTARKGGRSREPQPGTAFVFVFKALL